METANHQVTLSPYFWNFMINYKDEKNKQLKKTFFFKPF